MTAQLSPSLIRNLGLELPIFEDTPVVYGTLCDTKIPEVDSFVREVGLSTPARWLPLKSVVSIANEELRRIEGYCQSETVPHEWGLIPDGLEGQPKHHGISHGAHGDIPGYTLGAKVKKLSVIPWRADDTRLDVIERGLKRYEYREGVWELLDLNIGQFVCAQIDNSQKTEAFLTDIDLWIYKRD